MKKNRLSQKAGMPPGTIIHVGEENNTEIIMSVIFYNAQSMEQKQNIGIAECPEYLKKDGITWIDVIGVHNSKTIEAIGKQFNLHPLVLEDIANTEQIPKFEEFDDYIFFTLKNLQFMFNL